LIGEDLAYVKDLRILRGVDLSEVIIIDNSVLSFIFQIDNGIPILPFYNNKNDGELKFLINYLENLAQHKDIRSENKKLIPLEQFRQIVIHDESKYSDNSDGSNIFYLYLYY
jgi:CTD small phosphatase-like protein 2